MTKPSELYACLYAKEFPAQALLRLRPELHDKPCVVMEGEAPLQHVCSLNTKARLLGITRGMTQVEVDTFSNPVVLSRSRKVEKETRAILLECAGAFSPRVEDRSEETLISLRHRHSGNRKFIRAAGSAGEEPSATYQVAWYYAASDH